MNSSFLTTQYSVVTNRREANGEQREPKTDQSQKWEGNKLDVVVCGTVH